MSQLECGREHQHHSHVRDLLTNLTQAYIKSTGMIVTNSLQTYAALDLNTAAPLEEEDQGEVAYGNDIFGADELSDDDDYI